MKLSYDLHIHSCLSPCGDEDMLPSNIVGMAALKELDVIALTDHNSCKNCPATMKLAESYGITVIPGMELTTQEEVHVLCLFPELDNAMAFDSFVHDRMMPFENDESVFGRQLVVDENDRIVTKEPYLLINATSIDFGSVYDCVTNHGGIMIPAHVDKSTTSLLSNLGFIPPDSRFTCAEIKHIGFAEKILGENAYLKRCNIIHNSDAHYLEYIHEAEFFIEADSKAPADILRALAGYSF